MMVTQFGLIVVNIALPRRGELTRAWLIAFISRLILRQKCVLRSPNAKKRGAKKSVKYVLAGTLTILTPLRKGQPFVYLD